MCGITGFWDTTRQTSPERSRAIATQMADTIRHRGPDSSGVWADAQHGIALGHRRLSILDLSPEGHQPMLSQDGRLALIFNGEIYNFLDLRGELETLGHTFRGHGDTEVMLAAFGEWDVRPALEKFNGMFAFALWDRHEHCLHLGRDRLGEKPLYYGWAGHSLLFGSELKSLKAHPDFRAEINRDALALLLRHNYIPAPHCIYRGVFKLPPATFITFNGATRDAEPQPYWSARRAAESGLAEPFNGTDAQLVAALDALLRDSIKLRMAADVPLGAFLSGGVDSSTVVALMQAQSNRAVRTFSIGFEEDAFNEAEHARQVACHLQTDHNELYVSSSDALAVIPRLPAMYDEPFADSSQIPTFLVSQMARREVTVSLSGDGGDELFAGYERYATAQNGWNAMSRLPVGLRRMGSRAASRLSPRQWDRLFERTRYCLPARLRGRLSGDRLHKSLEMTGARTSLELYRNLVSHWQNPSSVVLGAREAQTHLNDSEQELTAASLVERFMYADTVSYLPDDILCKLDRASMAVGLETRVPLLDHRVVEFAWKTPLSLKIRDGQRKWLLRQVLFQYVPEHLINRPKMGFGVPVAQWLRGPLRPWAEALLDENRLQQEGFFDAAAIREKWTQHLSKERNWHYYLWNVLMFQAWLEEQ